jgi:CheY-like chemotaxis protein
LPPISSRPQPRDGAQADCAGREILVIEDDADLRGSLADVLLAEGHSVIAMADGLEALDYLEATQRPPALILLDLVMPRMDGFRFFGRLRGLSGPCADIPVLVLTADAGSQERAADLAPVAVLAKPVDLDGLLVAVSQALQGSSGKLM